MALDGVEYYGGVGFLKAGLQAAWAITTVSPTYAQEIRTPEFGMGLDGLINMRVERPLRHRQRHRHRDLGSGNRQASGRDLTRPTTLAAQAPTSAAVEERFGLERDDSPIFCVVSRLTWQKGMDILATMRRRICRGGRPARGPRFGRSGLEGALLAAAARHPGRVGVVDRL